MGVILFWVCFIIVIVIVSFSNEYANRGKAISSLINEREELKKTLNFLKLQVKTQLHQAIK